MMDCENILASLGFSATSLDDDGNVAVIRAPFVYEDGDFVPIYVETTPTHVRFFDDGETLFHLMGLGIHFSDKRKLKFLKNAIEPSGACVNDEGVIELIAAPEDTKGAFAKYMEAMHAVIAWEKCQTSDIDLSYFIDEVEMCLKAWKNGADVLVHPKYKGITGHEYTLNFSVDGHAYVVATCHPNSISAALKKLVDIRSAGENQSLVVTTIVDDRNATEAQKRDSIVLQTVGGVLDFSKLKSLAMVSQTAQ